MIDQIAAPSHSHGSVANASLDLSGPLGVLLCSVLFAVAVAVTLIGTHAHAEALSLGGAFGVVGFGLGAAPLQTVSHLSMYARLTGAMLIGLVVLLGLGALMADIPHLWHPVLAAIVVGSAASLLHLWGLLRARAEIMLALRALSDVRGAQIAGGGALVRTSLTMTLAGTLLWLVPAFSTHDPQPGISGLLAVMSPAWYAGLVAVVLGFAIGRRSEAAALLSTLSFGLAATLTPALVYATPRAGAAPKQMLITQYVLTHHHIDPTAGIYQAYSGLFSGMAWLCTLIGVHGMLGTYSLLGLGTYWPVIALLPRVLALRLFSERLLPTPGRRWIAVMLVMLVDTINDANYFSPQSVGYLLAIGALAFAVNGLGPRPFGGRATFWLLLLVGAVLAPTHELTPYLTAGALVVLALFGEAPYWSSLAVGVPALGWAALVHKAIGSNFSFSELFDISNLLPPGTAGVPGLERYPAIGYESHALLLALLILIGLAAIGFLAHIRTGWAWGFALCPVVGIGLILINPYGNEGIFRASLFAIPWLAVTAMRMPRPSRWLSPLVRPLVFGAVISGVLTVLLGTFVVAEWGDDGTSVIPRSDIAVAEYLRSRPPANAFVMSLGAGGDTIVSYPPFLVNYTQLTWDVVTNQTLRDVYPKPADLVALTDSYGAEAVDAGASATSPLYIYWSSSIRLDSAAYALQSVPQMNQWLKLLRSSPVWRLADHQGGSYLFELRRGLAA